MQLFGGEAVDDLQVLREGPAANAVLGKIPCRTSFRNYPASFAVEDGEKMRGQEIGGSCCPEYDMTIRSEFRDGNVTPGFRQLENLRESLRLLLPDEEPGGLVPLHPAKMHGKI